MDWVLENIMELLPIQSGDDDGIKAIWEKDLLLEARTMLSKGNRNSHCFNNKKDEADMAKEIVLTNTTRKFIVLVSLLLCLIKKKKKTQTLIQK